MDARIQAAIDAAIETGTFNLQAVEGIKQLRDANDALIARKERLEADLKSANVAYAAAEAQDKALRARLQAAEQEAATWKAKEAMLHLKEIDQAAALGEAKAVRWAFETVFKNTIVRENIQRSGTDSHNGPQGYTAHNVSGADTVEAPHRPGGLIMVSKPGIHRIAPGSRTARRMTQAQGARIADDSSIPESTRAHNAMI